MTRAPFVSCALRASHVLQKGKIIRFESTSVANHSKNIYSYGEGFLGALGTGKYEKIEVPEQLPSTTALKIKEISAGWAHAGFITEEGRVYTFGRTHSFRDVIRSTNIQRLVPWMLQMMNQFSLSQGMDTLIPLEIKFPLEEKAKKLVCSAALTLVLTESGKVYTFGANSFGQCGIGKESISVQDPELIAIGEEEEVVDIAAGYQHALAVTKNGAVFAWGKGERGQLGFGTANVSTPQEVIALKNKKVVEVSAGFNHSSALAADGELYVWGKLLNPLGTKGDEDQITPRLVKTRDSVRLLQCSHFHTAFITADHRAWVIGRTPFQRKEQEDRLVPISPRMHTNPFLLPSISELALNRVVKLGKGVDNTSFVTDNGQVFLWKSTTGFEKVQETKHLHIDAFQSGFRYNLLLGVPKET